MDCFQGAPQKCQSGGGAHPADIAAGIVTRPHKTLSFRASMLRMSGRAHLRNAKAAVVRTLPT